MNLDLMLQVVLLLSAVFYSIVVLGFIIGLLRIKYQPCNFTPFVSVIVAARNEVANLKVLLPSLLTQNYPSYEVIVANDRSADNSSGILKEYAKQFQILRVVDIISTSPDMPAKKNALAAAIRESKGEILCFTDADCVPSKRWITELVAAFDEHIGIVAGFSPYDENLLEQTPRDVLDKLLLKFISYEELKAAALSAGAIGLGKGWLCTGRNLAYRKKVYEEVGGFEKIRHSVSGDDDLFLQLVRHTTRWGVRYVSTHESYVPTVPPPSFRHFLQQRIRHFSAARYFPFSMKFFFLLFHLSNVLLFLGFIGFLFGIPELSLALPAFAAKLAADVTLFLLISESFSQKGFGGYFLLMEILYIFYNSFMGPLSLVASFQWKPDQKS